MSKRDVRADVLQAVCDVCCKHGLEHLTTKKLGEEARCSEAMIYYHFKSKQEILEATFLHIHGEIDAVFREHFIERGLVLERDTYNVCVETWMLYYGYWRDHPAQRAFYDAFIHSHYITNELWLRDNASYVFFTSMFGRLMGDVAQAAAVTHGHPLGYIPAAFLAGLILRTLRGEELRGAVQRARHDLFANFDDDADLRTFLERIDAAVALADDGTIADDLDAIRAAVEEVKPAHLEFIINGITWRDFHTMGMRWMDLHAMEATWADIHNKVMIQPRGEV